MSLKPIKGGRRHRSHAPRLEGGGWGAKRKDEYTDFRKWGKVGILASVIILGILATSYAYYSNIYLPSLPSVNPNYDPFTLLWNGTTTTPGSATSLTTIVSQNSGGSDQGINTGALGAGGFRFGECFQAPSSTFVYSFSVAIKKIGNPTGSINGLIRFGVNPLPPRSCEGGVPANGAVGSCNSFDASTLTTSYVLYALDYSCSPVAITSGATDEIEIDWANCASCDVNNKVTVEIASTAVATQNGYTFQPAAPACANPTAPTIPDQFCPTTYDLHFTISGSLACPSGYQCLNSGMAGDHNVQLSAKPAGPSTIDSFQSFNRMAQVGNASASGIFGGINRARGFLNPNPGETFTISASWQIQSVTLLFNVTGPMTGLMGLAIFPITGSPGTTAVATDGTLSIAKTFLDISTLTTGIASQFTFSFVNGPVLSAGSYSFVMSDNSTTTPGASGFQGNGLFQYAFQNGFGVSVDGIHDLFTPGAHFDRVAWFTIIGSPASAVALTSSPIDVLTSASKELFFYETWRNSTNLQTTAPWGWYLTVNSTLPIQANYSPLNDPSVVMANVVYPNAGDTKKNYYEYQAKTPGQSLFSASGTARDPWPSCPQTSTLYMCAGNQTSSGTQFLSISTTLNYTGNAGNTGFNGYSLLCVDATPANNPPASAFCSSATTSPVLSPCNSPGVQICATTTLPFMNIQAGPYYLGFWASSGQNATILFGTSNTGASSSKANSVWYWIPTPSCPPQCSTTDTSSYVGWLGKFLGGAYNAAAGALAPITAPILNAGNSFLAGMASALIQAGNLLIKGLTVLESILQSTMDVIGNAVGLGNVGTSFFGILNSIITFFASGNFNSIFTNAPTLFSRLIDSLAIYFPWLPTALGNASRFATLGINSIGFVLTIIGFMFQFVSAAFATYLIAMWFVYTGDDSLAGVLGLVETTQYLIFGLGLKYLAYLINFSLDVVTNLIGLIPKPLIQMVAHQFPRIPIVEVNARFVWPGGQMSEIRNGNILSAACWVSGILFLDMYETANPTLPGSIGFLLPSAVSSLAPLAGFIPFLEIMTAFVWGAAFLMIPINMLSNAFDFGELPFDSAVGTKISGGLGGIRFSRAQKRLQGRLEKKISQRMALKAESGASSQGVG